MPLSARPATHRRHGAPAHWPAPAAGPVAEPAGAARRDERLDTLRGYMLVAITLNHLDTELRVLSDYVFGFVSTAEGFVILSGLVAGLVYTRRSVRCTRGDLARHAWRRAGQIYGAHMASFLTGFVGLLLLALVNNTVSNTSPGLFFAHPVQALIAGATLVYQPGLFDILPMYCVFMVALPWILGALRQGQWRALFAVSGGFWLLSQAGLRDVLQRWLEQYAPVNLGAFDILAWQLLFVLGVFFGYHWARGTRLLSFRPALMALCLAVAVPLWLVLKYQRLPAGLTMGWVWSLADKTHLAPLRLLNFIVLAYLIAAVAVHWPRLVTFRPLALLGRNSLAVFSVQVTVCAFVLTQPYCFHSFASRTLTAVGMVALLFPAAWLNQAIGRRGRGAARPEPPVALPRVEPLKEVA